MVNWKEGSGLMSESEMITEDKTLTLTHLEKCGLHQLRRSVGRVSAIQSYETLRGYYTAGPCITCFH
jgi:hypothetical protein